ncbi:membrane protein [Pseudonocardia sp. EC080610-09]|uniref:DedA family protein n=1 Tax=unclassified Pseudonocardia TaxID=2619320 RepID=UPI0006CB1486|nr:MULTISPECIES: VTT domain-containing protein [unclassified Pseudonocardia]ALE73080.1 membrane protein [Pseudonocardia sp. EC080625-04]ALL76398.1 membrane protein [Pseudonocardia sp. EC080610-09]ALL83425.1 membrane protein [Pseudonocardia sp. EC080619-01]
MSEADARGTDTPDGRPEGPAPGGPGPDAAGPEASGPGTAAAGTGAPAGTQKKRFRWRNSDYTPEELAEAKKAWRDAMPWDHPMTRGDKFLVFSTLGIIAFMALTMPLRPFLLASHPIGLSFVTGSLSAIGAGAAFARIGEASLWLVVVAGIVGMIKFDWLFWLAGRRWGPKVVELFAPGEAAQRFVSKVRSWPRWALGLVVVLSTIPGVPAPAVFALAGLGRMRLATFLLFDALGAALMTGLVAGLGFGLGQHAVDVVLMIDEYALYVTLGLVAVVTVGSVRRDRKARAEREAATASASTTTTGTAE